MKTCPKCSSNIVAHGVCVNCGEPAQVADTAVDPLVGSVLDGRFQVEALIGSGGMGNVYRATQISLGKRVAVKVLHSRLSGDDRLRKRFQREARAASLLNHPNCIRVLDFGAAADGALFIVMEYLEGKSLADLLKEDRFLPWSEVIEILIGVCEALEEAHGQSVLHRDLKPDNIFLSAVQAGARLVKVLDFGIAKILDEEGRGTVLTAAGMICGTPEYMSPEHAQGEKLDHRTDIYALGCILYELLVGTPPFHGGLPMDILAKQVSQQQQLPSERCPSRQIPASLEWLCMRALSKNPDERPPSAAAFRQELSEARVELEPAPQSEAVIVSVPPPVDSFDTSEDHALEVALANTELAMPTLDRLQRTEVEAPIAAGGSYRRAFLIVSVLAGAVLVFLLTHQREREASNSEAVQSEPIVSVTPSVVIPVPEPFDADTHYDATPAHADASVKRDAGSASGGKVAMKPTRKARVKAVLARGRDLMARGMTKEAIAHFEGALAGKDANPEFHFELGRLYTRVSDPTRARWHLVEYLRLKPNSARRMLVESLLKAGK